MNFFSVSVSSITYLNCFFTRCLYFHYYWWWERRKNQFPKYLWPILLKFEEKILEIHRYSCLSITWIPQKIDPQTKPCWRHSSNQTASGTGPLCAKPIHSMLELSLSWAKFVFYLNNCLVPLRVLSYLESTVAACISSLAIYIFFSFSWTTDSTLKSTYSRGFQHKTISTIYRWAKKPPCFCSLAVILK